MSYIDAYHDVNKNVIHVNERDKDGKRILQEYSPNYSFYFSDAYGKHTSIYGEKCSRFYSHSQKTFKKEVGSHRNSGVNLFESDIKPAFKVLEEYYRGQEGPNLNICFFDIEVDFDKERGFAPPDDPFNEITAISLYNKWEDVCYCLVKAPSEMPDAVAQGICDQFENTILCRTEEEIIRIFLELIEDADVLSGWNSEGFDIPYIVGRIKKILGNEFARKLCLWGVMPKGRKFERYGKEQLTYDLVGRVHLDYLNLYRKYTYSELPSYSLDAVGEHELNERKVAYQGSLDDLYHNDFKTFIEYSRQDTMLLARIDDKNKFITLTNAIAHENCVLFATTMGAVGLSDNALVLETHDRGFVVPDRPKRDWNEVSYDPLFYDLDDEEASPGQKKTKISRMEAIAIMDKSIAGAYVAQPKKGLTPWVGSVDITSLYPSIIMALNISPETIYGQLDQTDMKEYLLDRIVNQNMGLAQAWNGIFDIFEAKRVVDRSTEKVIFVTESNRKITNTLTLTGRELATYLADDENKLCLSANGTVFSYEQEGIIPGLLARWFDERKELQGKAKAITKDIAENDYKGEELALKREEFAYWDRRQLVKKIALNSVYGAITNAGSRFFDQRMGQSITLTGRSIARHMAGTINQIITGTFDHQGESIVYGDTDSAYFSAWPIKDKLAETGFEFTEDSVVEMYDAVADAANDTFPDFMKNAYHAEHKRSLRIKASREICATSALFVKKKRYAAMVYDNEGFRIPGGKLKIMGMETQRSDTPAYVQVFLKDILKMVLSDKHEDAVIDAIRIFRQQLRNKEDWEMGTPKRCNNMTKYTAMENAKRHSRLPGHIRAAYNWNRLKTAVGDNVSPEIPDGGKTIVCKLKKNAYDIKSIAYPIDMVTFPDWFQELPFDTDLMEFTLIDKKINNLIGVLNMNLAASKQSAVITDMFKF